MRLFALSALVMVAFAGNSLLNRAALDAGLIGALPFALIRVSSGALVLGALAWAGGGRPGGAGAGGARPVAASPDPARSTGTPGLARSSLVQPDLAQSGAAQSGSAQSGLAQSGLAQPGGALPTEARSVGAWPSLTRAHLTPAHLTPARLTPARLAPALWLAVYLLGFSLAYQALDAGIGALILFALVQVTMLTGALCSGERPPVRRLLGAGLALLGLGALLWPGTAAVPAALPAAAMALAAVGWGLYSLAGRRATDPLRATAANFLLATPLVALPVLGLALSPAGIGPLRPGGVALAVVSGAITSGLGYALWYAILPQLGAARAAVAQLSVPVIALAAGVLLLGERLSPGAALAAAVVLAGVALALLPQTRRHP